MHTHPHAHPPTHTHTHTHTHTTPTPTHTHTHTHAHTHTHTLSETIIGQPPSSPTKKLTGLIQLIIKTKTNAMFATICYK